MTYKRHANAVSYTHLDVYKRQVPMAEISIPDHMLSVEEKTGGDLIIWEQ